MLLNRSLAETIFLYKENPFSVVFVPSLCIYPTENIQMSAGDYPSYTGGCQTPHHRPAKTYFQLFLATPTDNEQWNSSHSGSELHCQLELLGTVENTIFAGRWCGVCPNLYKTQFIEA